MFLIYVLIPGLKKTLSLSTKTYDIIIAGAGLSGLSLAWYLADSGYKGNVLLIDRTFAPHNKKTWCFWTKEKPYFPQIIYKKWRKAFFSAYTFDSFLYMNNYMYYCIRENDFKEHVLSKLKKLSNFHLLEEGILDISGSKKKGVLVTKNSETYVASHIFQSIIKPDSAKKKNLKYPLIQHFYGIEIKTEDSTFDPETFTIMDVDEFYEDGYAFMYVLPYTHNTALIEYTIFSEKIEKKKFYRAKIKEYLSQKFGYKKGDYKVTRKEFGKIPMDDRAFIPTLHPNVYNIGSIGGFSKPSTGYTFLRVQQFSKELAKTLVQNEPIRLEDPSKMKYRYYDKLLLHILANSTQDSRQVFMHLFKNNSIDNIFDFLNEDTTLIDDLKIMSSVPYMPFFKAIASNLR